MNPARDKPAAGRLAWSPSCCPSADNRFHVPRGTQNRLAKNRARSPERSHAKRVSMRSEWHFGLACQVGWAQTARHRRGGESNGPWTGPARDTDSCPTWDMKSALGKWSAGGPTAGAPGDFVLRSTSGCRNETSPTSHSPAPRHSPRPERSWTRRQAAAWAQRGCQAQPGGRAGSDTSRSPRLPVQPALPTPGCPSNARLAGMARILQVIVAAAESGFDYYEPNHRTRPDCRRSHDDRLRPP